MGNSNLLKKSEVFVEDLLSKLPEGYCYHNLEHTREVVAATDEIGRATDLSEEELNTVKIAAWFHDVGYECDSEHHEEESIKIMEEALSKWGAGQSKIREISAIIASTKMPQSPKNTLSKVLCDADMYHLSTDDFRTKSEYLKKELANTFNKKMDSREWQHVTSKFLDTHSYFTNYGKVVLAPKKDKNVKKLKKEELNSKDKKYLLSLEKEVVKLKNKIERDKKLKPDRGIETMFRITSKNHLTLSGMADNKANIMISINSIILSVLVTVLFRKFEEYPNLFVPAMMLVGACLTTIVFAVLATRPNVSSGKFKREDIINKETNLLFFGNFHSMELQNYMWGMKEMMKDADYLYGSMIKDIYFLGIVLGKKYRMLRKSYTIFMFGFVVSILAFIVALVFFPV